MEYRPIFFIFFALFFSLHVSATEIDDPYKNIKYFTLDNGMQVYILSDKLAVNTQIELSVNVGYGLETKENAGISHLVEHLLFRDQRIAHKDYLDYIKEEGATYVNGYTRERTTGYLATIDSNQSYWIVKTFAKMIFDKEINEEDLSIEKGALQTEIGEFKWYQIPLFYVGEFLKLFEKIEPEESNIYTDDFSMQEENEIRSRYYAKKNNQDFTLEEVLEHYNTYYYPSNMLLKVVGNFDTSKMKEVIKKSFEGVDKKGNKRSHELTYDASLNAKVYKEFTSGLTAKSGATIGAKYILDDYKKYLILSAYTSHLSDTMQQLLRNDLGQTYSVTTYNSSYRNGAIAGVSFTSLHDDFDDNLVRIQKQIAADRKHMDTNEIKLALKEYALFYSSIEHDSESLLDLIETQVYIQKYHDLNNTTAYAVFLSITPKAFQKVITETFKEENGFLQVYRDYYFFPYDMLIILLLELLLSIVAFFKMHTINWKNSPLFYTQREVIFSRRLMNRFDSFGYFLLMLYASEFITAWSEYLVFGRINTFQSVDAPMHYVIGSISALYYFIVFVLIGRYIFKDFYVRLDITCKGINFIGTTHNFIEKNEILDVRKVPYSPTKYFKTYGSSILFLKPLVKIDTINDKVIYLRAKNADHLVEDILEWKNTNECEHI